MADQPPSSDLSSIVRRRDYWPGFKRECKVNISAWFLEESCFISNRQNILNTTMVFNKKEKSFSENFTFFAKFFLFVTILLHFCISFTHGKFCFNLFRKNMRLKIFVIFLETINTTIHNKGVVMSHLTYSELMSSAPGLNENWRGYINGII